MVSMTDSGTATLRHLFLHLFIHFFSVFLFGYILQVAVLIGHPATVDTEIVLVDALSLFLAPFLLVAFGKANARLAVEIDANGVHGIATDDADGHSFLQTDELGSCEIDAVGKCLQVTTNDRLGDGENLIGAGINLVEAFHLTSVLCDHGRKDSIVVLQQFLLFVGEAFNGRMLQDGIKDYVHVAVLIGNKGEAGAGMDVLALVVGDVYG